jgi:sugar phosphate isomerase/epimerase
MLTSWRAWTLKPHIRSTHVHDNGGQKDDHLWPGEGTIDWKSAMEMLQSAPHMPPCLLEVKNGEQVNVPEKTAEAFKKFGV